MNSNSLKLTNAITRSMESTFILDAWLSFAISTALLLFFSVLFTLHYSDRHERAPFAMVITILSLTLCLATIALFPIDIFLVSNIMDPRTGLRKPWATDDAIHEIQSTITTVYYVAYSLIASCSFFWIPISYFYFEEMADDGHSIIKRLWSSFKYTIYFILISTILFLTGLLMQSERHNGINLDWLKKFIKTLGDGTVPVAFLATVFTFIGLAITIFYSAPGLSLLPLHLLAGVKSINERSDDTSVLLAANRERQNLILSRYQQLQHRPTAVIRGRNPVLTESDRQAMSELAQEEMMLTNRSRRVKKLRDSCLHRFQPFIRPFEVLLGLVGAALSILLIVSMLTTSISQTNNGGYVFQGDIPNPLNIILLKFSPYFPIDYILIVILVLYMFWATTKGVISLGIRVLWVNLYEFRKTATQPQGLLAATMIFMLSLSGLGYSLTTTIAPEYSMYGSQLYCNNTVPITGKHDCADKSHLIIPCHTGAPSDLCVPTITSTIILKIISATPSLGNGFLYMQWGFIGMFFLALIFNLIRGYMWGFSIDPLDDGDDDLEEIEARGLLSGELDSEDGRRRARRKDLLRGNNRDLNGPSSYGAVDNNPRSNLGNTGQQRR